VKTDTCRLGRIAPDTRKEALGIAELPIRSSTIWPLSADYLLRPHWNPHAKQAHFSIGPKVCQG